MLDAGNFVRTLIERQALQIGSPDEVAFQFVWIDEVTLNKSIKIFEKNSYGNHLRKLLV